MMTGAAFPMSTGLREIGIVHRIRASDVLGASFTAGAVWASMYLAWRILGSLYHAFQQTIANLAWVVGAVVFTILFLFVALHPSTRNRLNEVMSWTQETPLGSAFEQAHDLGKLALKAART
jgi:predicted metal-binding membrane protein